MIKLMNNIFHKQGFPADLSREETLAIMKTYDINHDGRLTKKEFLTVFTEYKKQLTWMYYVLKIHVIR